MKLIDKEKVIAEIEKLYKENYRFLPSDIVEGVQDFKDDLLMVLDTLEVKEVNLEKEIIDYIYTLPYSKTGIPGGWKHSWSEENVIKTAKYFYELGLKAKKGE